MIRIVWTHDQNHVDTCLAKCGHMFGKVWTHEYHVKKLCSFRVFTHVDPGLCHRGRYLSPNQLPSFSRLLPLSSSCWFRSRVGFSSWRLKFLLGRRSEHPRFLGGFVVLGGFIFVVLVWVIWVISAVVLLVCANLTVTSTPYNNISTRSFEKLWWHPMCHASTRRCWPNVTFSRWLFLFRDLMFDLCEDHVDTCDFPWGHMGQTIRTHACWDEDTCLGKFLYSW